MTVPDASTGREYERGDAGPGRPAGHHSRQGP